MEMQCMERHVLLTTKGTKATKINPSERRWRPALDQLPLPFLGDLGALGGGCLALAVPLHLHAAALIARIPS
jgi:hypothetical protein